MTVCIDRLLLLQRISVTSGGKRREDKPLLLEPQRLFTYETHKVN